MVQTAIGPDAPPPLSVWPELVSDEAISKLCFAGLAAHTLFRGADGALHSDFLWLSGLPTRPG